ncbi:MAG: N-acetylmuramoyl-L-alanine amidase [Faecalibacterium prausnitzii]
MAGRSNPRHARRRRQGGPSTATVIGLLVCVVCFSAAFFLWKAALFGFGRNESGEEPFRPVVGDPPYRVCIDAGHGGSDPGARGVVEEKEMTAQTSEALLALLEADPNYIPLRSRESYDVTAKPSERAEAINAQSPQLLLSIHGNSAPEVLPLQALSVIRPFRAVHGIRRAITSRSSWRRECRPQAQSSAATAASGTFIIRAR